MVLCYSGAILCGFGCVCAIITSMLDAIGLQQMDEVILHNQYDSILWYTYLLIYLLLDFQEKSNYCSNKL